MTKNEQRKDDQKLLLIYDPILPRNKSTHQPDVNEFILNLAKEFYSEVVQLKSFSAIQSRSKVLNRITNGTLLFLNAAITGINISLESKSRNNISIFNPNDDPISLLTFLTFRKLLRGRWRVITRFICTRDSFLTKTRISFIFFWSIKKLMGPTDCFGAETLEYAQFLERHSKIGVKHIPYPPVDELRQLKNNSRHSEIFCVLGAARKDKGFNELPDLISAIQEKIHGARFIIQKAEVPWQEYSETESILLTMKNVSLLPYLLTKNQIQEILSECDVVLLPYDRNIYRFRGSAFARRGMYLGKSIMATSKTSMSEEAQRLGFSLTLNNMDSRPLPESLYHVGSTLKSQATQIWKDFLD